MSLLQVENLCVDFSDGERRIPVVSSVSFRVEPGEILALVGESGCGKSISCLALTQLTPPGASVRANSIEFNGKKKSVELIGATDRELRQVRGGGIAYIFQEPMVSLNPVLRVGAQVAESVKLHRPEITDVHGEVVRLLKMVGIPEPEARYKCYPHELSGGMQQRVMIAMALGGDPALLVADEPTTALDVTIQSQILQLLKEQCQARQMGMILVTHNLGIVANMADRVAVMYAGQIVESAASADLFAHPTHPYTKALLSAVPQLGRHCAQLTTIPGTVPPPAQYPKGCRFFDRCAKYGKLDETGQNRCRTEAPELFELSNTQCCRCFYPEDGHDAQ